DPRAAPLTGLLLRPAVERDDRQPPAVPLDRTEVPVGVLALAAPLGRRERDHLGDAHPRHEQPFLLERDQQAVELLLLAHNVRPSNASIALISWLSWYGLLR